MLVRFPEIILGSHAFFYRDAGLFGYPVASYIKNSFWHGELPLWNPYSNCGIPFRAMEHDGALSRLVALHRISYAVVDERLSACAHVCPQWH